MPLSARTGGARTPRIDVHRHVWTEPLIAALAARMARPRARCEAPGRWRIELSGEPASVVAAGPDAADAAGDLVRRDRLDAALAALSSPLGIEALPADDAAPLLEAYHAGAEALPGPFGFWGALGIAEPDADEVDAVLARGAAGASLPAGVLASPAGLDHVAPLLRRLADRGAPLFVHPGPAPWATTEQAGPWTPAWWPAATTYVAQMHAAWMAWAATGRAQNPRLVVVFAMLAGLAPLHRDRLETRGGPAGAGADGRTFYEVSSYGRAAVEAVASATGRDRILFGSDRPVVADLPLAADDAAWDGDFRRNAARLLPGRLEVAA